jgi:undecaprenyl-diphosphatase
MYEILVKLLADGSLVLIALIGAWALLKYIPKGSRYEAYTRMLMAGLTALMVARFVASIYQPSTERPFEILGAKAGAAYLNNPGFPSDHALFAMTITLAVWFETRKKKIAYILLGLTIVMAAARVLALVHTPLDVIGGMVLACVGVLWYDPKLLMLKRHHTTTSHKAQK